VCCHEDLPEFALAQLLADLEVGKGEGLGGRVVEGKRIGGGAWQGWVVMWVEDREGVMGLFGVVSWDRWFGVVGLL
jgi:hypothetical protein